MAADTFKEPFSFAFFGLQKKFCPSQQLQQKLLAKSFIQ